jgi:hypothetical protein
MQTKLLNLKRKPNVRNVERKGIGNASASRIRKMVIMTSLGIRELT